MSAFASIQQTLSTLSGKILTALALAVVGVVAFSSTASAAAQATASVSVSRKCVNGQVVLTGNAIGTAKEQVSIVMQFGDQSSTTELLNPGGYIELSPIETGLTSVTTGTNATFVVTSTSNPNNAVTRSAPVRAITCQ